MPKEKVIIFMFSFLNWDYIVFMIFDELIFSISFRTEYIERDEKK